MYLSHEAVLWVVLLVLPYLLSSNFYSDFWFYYYYYYVTYFWLYHLCTTPLISCHYHIAHCLSLAWYYVCITVPNLLTFLYMVLYGFFNYCIITASWWFILFYLAIIVDSSSCVNSVDENMRYMVYRWGFPYLNYPLKISISWIYQLSPYNWFCRLCTSHHLISHSCSGVYALRHKFKCMLLIWIYRYTCAYPCTPLGIHHPTRWAVSDSPGSACPDPKVWTMIDIQLIRVTQREHSGSAEDQSRTPIFQAPCLSLEFFFCNSLFFTVYIVHLLVFSHLRLSVM